MQLQNYIIKILIAQIVIHIFNSTLRCSSYKFMSNQTLTDFLIQYQLQLTIEKGKGGGGGHCSQENVIHL